jgi:GTPase SAR1 family protein
MVKKVKLPFTPSLEVEFVDRERCLKQVFEWAERGAGLPIVVFGPEGCGKTSWLRQASEILRELDYDVIYTDPLRREFIAYTNVSDVVRKLSEVVAEAVGVAQLKLATLSVDLVKELITKWRRKRVAVLIDDVFQAIGLDRAELYVKSVLGLIEHPSTSYESIVAIISTSEGLTRSRIGRHRWAELRAMWNMGREGFSELYEELKRVLSNMPSFDDVWLLTGGNPALFSRLCQVNWNIDAVIFALIEDKGVTPSFTSKWRSWLEKAIEDPDILWSPDTPWELINELVEKNLIVYNMHKRLEYRWVDTPPPEKDLALGVGRYVAWQTPLHREAVKRALRES